MDAATNVLSKCKTNIIAHDPQGWFVEFLPIDLQKETADSMADKVTSSITELHRLIGRRLVTALISDSCNTMCLLRTTLVDTGVVTYAYGCAAHPLHNLCEDLIKIPLTKAIFTSSVFISKRIRNQGLCNKIFSSVCTELLGKPLAMVLYSATRLSSTNYMFCRLRRCKRPLMALPTVVENEKPERGIDLDYALPVELAAKLVDSSFWRGVDDVILLFDPICKALGVLEGDAATMSTAYAAFVFVYYHLSSVQGLGTSRNDALKCLLRRWGRIYSPVHALAFFCDPFYYKMRKNVEAKIGNTPLQMGKGGLKEQCRCAIQLLSRLHEAPDVGLSYHDLLLAEFMHFSVVDEAFSLANKSIEHFHPKLVWAQANEQFPVLSACMVKIFCGHASAAGVERNHKVSANVHTALRNRMGSGKVERQVAVAHNAKVISRGAPQIRHKFARVMANTCDPTATAGSVEDNELNAAELVCAQLQAAGQDVEDALDLLLTPEERLEQLVLQQSLEGLDAVEETVV
jgi:hypothetical protein